MDSEVSADSILPCPCGMDVSWLSFKVYDPQSNHPKAVRVERSILGLKELSIKAAGEVHSFSEAYASALPCSNWESLLELDPANVERMEPIDRWIDDLMSSTLSAGGCWPNGSYSAIADAVL